MMNNILITGACGFIGNHLIQYLEDHCAPHNIIIVDRDLGALDPSNSLFRNLFFIKIQDLDTFNGWDGILTKYEISAVIHLAARVHKKNEISNKFLPQYINTNTTATINLLQACIKNNVKKFIFLSTVAIYGNKSIAPLKETDLIKLMSPYATSKFLAEKKIQELCAGTKTNFTIIRPPMVYGKNAKGNITTLVKCVKKGLPLPLAGIHNKRSFIHVLNLCNFITHCIVNEKSNNEIFLISDNNDISVPHLIKKISIILKKQARLFYLPPRLLSACATCLLSRALYNKLCDSFQINITKAKTLLCWEPVITMDEGLSELLSDPIMEK